MKIRKPAYFDRFSCLAGACPDSCCREWDVQVDETSAAFYRSLPGPLGDRLRQVLVREEGEVYLTIQEGRCPMWQPDGLCRIQAELGEAALCRTCREFPRLTHDFGDFVEYGLELSCPEAARLILRCENRPPVELEQPGGEPGDYDREAMALLLSSRQTMGRLLSDQSRPEGEVLALALLYGVQAQSELDGEEVSPFCPEAALETGRLLAQPGTMEEILRFFRGLERLTDRWDALLDAPRPGPWQPEHLALARYFVDRYWLQAAADYDLYSRVKLAVSCCLLVRYLGGDPVQTSQLLSKEIENSAQNVDALLDAAYECPAFTDGKLLGLLLHP